jgi:hypothetical protein
MWEYFQKRMEQDEFQATVDVTMSDQSKTLAPIRKDLDVCTVIRNKEQREWLLTIMRIWGAELQRG